MQINTCTNEMKKKEKLTFRAPDTTKDTLIRLTKHFAGIGQSLDDTQLHSQNWS